MITSKKKEPFNFYFICLHFTKIHVSYVIKSSFVIESNKWGKVPSFTSGNMSARTLIIHLHLKQAHVPYNDFEQIPAFSSTFHSCNSNTFVPIVYESL